MLNIVIPMAGAGSRFVVAGYKDPKPLIPVRGVPMIKVVIDNLKPATEHRFIFICQKEHQKTFHLREKLTDWSPGCEVIEIDGLTEGAACTVLKARHIIDNSSQLMIANCDQYVDININEYLDKMASENLHGLIMTMQANDPKWSFVALDNNNLVTNVVEKEVISNEATVGIYNFRKGSEFVMAADNMINSNLRVNNEFYVAPVYNDLIDKNANIGVFNIGCEANGMYGLGVPEDLDLFVTLPVSNKVQDT